MEHYYIGVDVGGTKIAFGLFDKEHRLITRSRIPSDREIDGPKLSALLLRQCDLLLETASAKGTAFGYWRSDAFLYSAKGRADFKDLQFAQHTGFSDAGLLKLPDRGRGAAGK